MKVGIISDSPTVTTGFGITTNQIAHALTEARHNVVCFGMKAIGETFDRSMFPFKIWTVGLGSNWVGLIPKFLAHEKPDALIFNMDIFNMKECFGYCGEAGWKGPIISYLILDGIPVYKEYIAAQSRATLTIATTNTAADYLKDSGIPIFAIAPPGVDMETFVHLPNSESLKCAAGFKDKFVVGVFGRNTDRKQQIRTLLALAYLKQIGKHSDLLIYFHCQPRGYWNLDEIANQLGIGGSVIFPGVSLLDETAGVPYMRSDTVTNRSTKSSRLRKSEIRMPSRYTYVERMNCCDLIVNASHCGDFEQVIIEAQACGIPFAGTNDNGIMAEALGEGGLLLNALDIGFWKAGQRNYMVSPQSIANAIISVKEDQELGLSLRERGLKNARLYPWHRVKDNMIKAIAHL